MGTIIDKLNAIESSKEAIRVAIEGKGIEIPTTTKFSEYASKIEAIQVGGGGSGSGSGDGASAFARFDHYRQLVQDIKAQADPTKGKFSIISVQKCGFGGATYTSVFGEWYAPSGGLMTNDGRTWSEGETGKIPAVEYNGEYYIWAVEYSDSLSDMNFQKGTIACGIVVNDASVASTTVAYTIYTSNPQNMIYIDFGGLAFTSYNFYQMLQKNYRTFMGCDNYEFNNNDLSSFFVPAYYFSLRHIGVSSDSVSSGNITVDACYDLDEESLTQLIASVDADLVGLSSSISAYYLTPEQKAMCDAKDLYYSVKVSSK